MKLLAKLLTGCALTLCAQLLPAQDITAQVKQDVRDKIEAALPEAAPAKPQKERRVLIFSKTNGFRHGSIPVGVLSLKRLGEKTGAYTADHTEDESAFEPENLQKYDAVIMLNTTGEVFRPKELPQDPAARQKALEREERLKQSLAGFVKSGKGLAGTHSATDTYHNWKEYNQMMGGTFAGHPWHQEVPIKNLDPDSPVNKPFGEQGFQVNDEIYQFRGDTALPSDRRMLLALDPQQMDLSKGNRQDGFYPVSWIATYGGGRTFYCSLGHRDEIYYNPKVLQHYLAGFQYAMGDLEADASPSK
jgi:uncharacterized protein